jgi:cytochrome c oxidase subunit 2
MNAFTAFLAALPVRGAPRPGEMGMQHPATPVMETLYGFHTFLLIIIAVITLFVLALLVWVLIRYSAKRNPVPAKFSHNTLVEVLWTAVPVLILVAIAVPSFKLLYMQDVIPESDMTIKATGHQWYWDYEYVDSGMTVTSIMTPREDAEAQGRIPLLAADDPLVVPAGATVRMQVTASDVIHAWTVPAFGVKVDAVPGRLNEIWFRVDEPGIYYGQCSELCGKDHAFMPIEVHVVPAAQFTAWMNEQTGGTSVASAGGAAAVATLD